jgi:hypothetical protein
MFRPSDEAKAVMVGAFKQATRFGHPYTGCEHLVLALAGTDDRTGTVLREAGITPGAVEEQITRLSGGGFFGDLDRGALAAVGIDVDAIRASVTAGFGGAALSQASRAAHRSPAWWNPRVRGGIELRGAFLPHTPDMKRCLHLALRERLARHDAQVGPAHLAYGVLSATDGMAPAVLAALDAPVPALRAALFSS